MASGKMTGWFARLLDGRILPALETFGFNRRLARSFMALSAPAWESMGPMPSSGLRIDPGLIRAIEEIRTGTQADFQRQSEAKGLLEGFRPSALRSLAARSAEPVNLTTLIDHIPASWLILPRAYRTMDLHDSRCLLVYLSYLRDEQAPGFRKVLTRVLIEYIGNFTLKYHRSTLSDEEVATALFFGWAAMFWKNLRQPAAGRPDDLICASLFRWAQRLYHNHLQPCSKVEETIGHMSLFIQQIFPQPDAFGRIPAAVRYQPQTSLIALRHGEPGIAAVLLHLGPSSCLYNDATAGRVPYTRVPASLQSLLHTVKGRWKAETPATCNNIRCFLVRLADRYRIARQNAGAINAPALRFTASRTIALIDSFCASPA